MKDHQSANRKSANLSVAQNASKNAKSLALSPPQSILMQRKLNMPAAMTETVQRVDHSRGLSEGMRELIRSETRVSDPGLMPRTVDINLGHEGDPRSLAEEDGQRFDGYSNITYKTEHSILDHDKNNLVIKHIGNSTPREGEGSQGKIASADLVLSQLHIAGIEARSTRLIELNNVVHEPARPVTELLRTAYLQVHPPGADREQEAAGEDAADRIIPRRATKLLEQPPYNIEGAIARLLQTPLGKMTRKIAERIGKQVDVANVSFKMSSNPGLYLGLTWNARLPLIDAGAE